MPFCIKKPCWENMHKSFYLIKNSFNIWYKSLEDYLNHTSDVLLF